MKKTMIGFVVAGVLGVTGSLVMAQDQTPASPTQADGSDQTRQRTHVVDPAVQAQHMAKRLNLTSDQQTQVLNVLTAQQDQVKGLRGDSSLSREDRHVKMQSIRADSQSKIRALLTDDQRQRFDQMQQQRRDRQASHKS